MEANPRDPLDAGQRNRRKRAKRRIPKRARRVLRNRRVLITAFSVVQAIVKLARLIGEIFGGS